MNLKLSSRYNLNSCYKKQEFEEKSEAVGRAPLPGASNARRGHRACRSRTGMSRICLFLIIGAVTCTSAKVVNFTDAPFSAVGDETTDNRNALQKALNTLEKDDTLLIPPGTFKIVLAESKISVPSGITILGQGSKSVLNLASTEKDKYRAFSSLNNDVTIEGITIKRDGDFPLVMFPLFGERSNITFRNCVIDGNKNIYPEEYCHIFQVGHGNLKNLLLQGIVLRNSSFGLFQDNKATGSVDTVIVEQCLFENNSASDLEFNSPNGTMTDIIVRNCFFRDNLCKSAGAGFAVGFANVKNSKVSTCDIRGYGSEALHVEDRSTNIHLTGNTITGGSLMQNNGVIMVLSDSKNVFIENNVVDGRPNNNKPHLVLVTAGGNRFRCPSDISVVSNIFVNGESTRTWYLQPGSGPRPVHNVITKWEDCTERKIIPAKSDGKPVPKEVMQSIYEEVKTPYKYGVIIKGEEGHMVDCPSVFRHKDKWYMMYIIFDGNGYETALAESSDLLDWKTLGKILPFRNGTWDALQAAGYVALQDHSWGGSYELEKHDGKYWMSYLGGKLKGYEADPLMVGLAWSKDPVKAEPWTRLTAPVLTRDQPDCRDWEKLTQYKSNIIHDKSKSLGYPYVMFYNAKTVSGYERIGIAVSNDMTTWLRYGNDPVVDNGSGISGDPQITKIGDVWVMFYFGAFWKPKAFDTFACSYDLSTWTKWDGPHLVEPTEPWDEQYAHKPWMVKHNGIVYHFYNAVGKEGRVIALATSKELKTKNESK